MRRRWFALGIAVAGLLVWLGGGLEPVVGTDEAADSDVPSAGLAVRPSPSQAPARPLGTASAVAATSIRAPLGDPAEPARQAAARDAQGGCGDGRPFSPGWAAGVRDAAVAAVTGTAVARHRGASAGTGPLPEPDLAALRELQRERLETLGQGAVAPQAAALMLKLSLEEQELAERSRDSEPSAAGERRRREAIAAASATRLAHLWRVGSSLPVLRLALGQCLQQPAPALADCATPLVRDWVLVEPDNAAAWLWQATLSAARGDVQGLDDAMYRASQAPRLDSHVLELLQVLAEPAFDAAGGAAAAALQIQWVGLVMSEVGTEVSRIARYCDAAGLRDANRAQRCDALARLLVERDGTLLGLVSGRGLGQRLGWSSERLAKIDQLRLAVEAQTSTGAAADDPAGCSGHKQLRQTLLGIARRGEIGHHRQLMAAAGLSEAGAAETARRRRAAQAAADAAAQSAESPASAEAATDPLR